MSLSKAGNGPFCLVYRCVSIDCRGPVGRHSETIKGGRRRWLRILAVGVSRLFPVLLMCRRALPACRLVRFFGSVSGRRRLAICKLFSWHLVLVPLNSAAYARLAGRFANAGTQPIIPARASAEHDVAVTAAASMLAGLGIVSASMIYRMAPSG